MSQPARIQTFPAQTMPEFSRSMYANYDPGFVSGKIVPDFLRAGVVILRGVVPEEERERLLELCSVSADSSDQVVDNEETEKAAPSFNIVRALFAYRFSETAAVSYRLRPRRVDSFTDSLPHIDNMSSTIEDLEHLRIVPGIRAIHQLSGGSTNISTQSLDGRTNYTGRIEDGDAWIIALDRFLGLPVRTSVNGPVAYLRHPVHQAINLRDRRIAIQDISMPLETAGYLRAFNMCLTSTEILPQETYANLVDNAECAVYDSPRLLVARNTIARLYGHNV